MDSRLLEAKIKGYLCPFCGEWHEYNEDHKLSHFHSIVNKVLFTCIHDESDEVTYYFEDGNCYYDTYDSCLDGLDIEGKIKIEEIVENCNKPRVTFSVPFTTGSDINMEKCDGCDFIHKCLPLNQSVKTGKHEIEIPFGFEFEQSDYDKFSKVSRFSVKEKELQEREQAIYGKEVDLQEREKTISSKESELREREGIINSKEQLYNQSQVKENKEEIIMAEKTTGIWEQLYEHSPKENVEIAKRWAEKYKPTLKWAVPVVAIYAAYKILNSKESKIDIDNIDGICEENLGFKFDNLKNKTAIRELMAVGGLTAGAYAAIKGISTIYGKNGAKELSVEQIEDSMDKLDGASKKFGFIQPKTEKMLPVALSVITVYVLTQKTKQLEKLTEKIKYMTGDLGIKAKVYGEMVKLFIADRLNIDLENEEEKKKARKFIFLAAILGVSVLLYGRKVLGDKAVDVSEEDNETENKGMKVFIQQVISIMEKMLPSAFTGLTTWLVAKKVLKSEATGYVETDCAEEDEFFEDQSSYEEECDSREAENCNADEMNNNAESTASTGESTVNDVEK